MTLPTFLGIGVPRAGTTWLHQLLSAHPDVFLPSRRKEVRFFDRHHEEGQGWYEGFFCPPDEADRYSAIGERLRWSALGRALKPASRGVPRAGRAGA